MKSQYLLNAFPDLAIISVNIAGKIIESNQKAKDIFGNNLQKDRAFLELLEDDIIIEDGNITSFEKFLEKLCQYNTSLQSIAFKHQIYKILRLKLEVQNINNENDELQGYLFTLTPIEKTQNFYKFTTELSNDIITIHNSSGKREFVSASVERILGYKKEEVLEWATFQNVHEDDLGKLEDIVTNAREKKDKEWRSTYRLKHKKGHYIWLEVNTHYFYDKQYNIKQVVVILKDISERKIYEQAIEQNHKFIKSIANTIPHIIYVYDYEHQKLIYLNYAITQVLGYSLEEAHTNDGLFFKKLLKKTYEQKFEAHYQQLAQLETEENRVFQNTYQLRHKNGEYYWFLVSETVFDFDKNNQVKQVVGIIQNVHQEKVAQQNLESQKELLEKILDNLPVNIFIKNQEGKYLFMNQAVLEENGYQRQDILHKTDGELFTEEVTKEYLNTDKITKEKKFYTWEESNEENKHKLIGKKLIHLNQEDTDAILGYALDISEQKNAEKEIIENKSFIQAFTQTIPEDLFVFNFKQYKYIYSNHDIIESLGYSVQEVESLGARGALSLVHPKDKEKFIAHRKDIANATDSIYELDYKVKHKDGDYHHLHSRIIPYTFDKNGKLETIIGTLQDITAQERLISALREIKQRQELASQAGNVGIWDWDIKQNIVHIDMRLQEMLKYQKDDREITWEEWLQTIFQPDRANVEKAIQYCLDNHEETYQLEQRHTVKNKKPKWFLTQGRIYWDENNQPKRMIGTSTDITRLKHAESRLIRAKIEAEQATQAKSKFLSTMSHEIRTPMNAVIGMTNLLLQKNPQAEQMKYLDTLKFSAENLLALINDILDFTKVESGKIVFERVSFNLKDLLDNIEKSHKQKAKQKKIRLIFLIASDLPEFVVGDPIRISQVLNNLLSNAIKFTNEGFVKLEIFLENEDENIADIHFVVSDTGIGIALELQDKIFDSFTQANPDTTRKFGGTGLGLAITKQLLELQNSEIFLESKPNQGAKFSFSLKLEKPQQERKDTTENTKQVIEASDKDEMIETNMFLLNIKVLLVEDNEVNQFLATEFLTMWGIEIDYAMNGKEAIKQVLKNDYDLILMDLQMPIMDGYTAAQNIRQIEQGKYLELPIIALTAEVMPDTFDKVQKSQMNDYIGKPFQPQELYKKIAKYIKNKSSEEQNTSLNLLESINQVSQNDIGTAKRLAKLMITLFEELSEQYSLSMQNRNLEDLRFIAHKAKSSIKVLKLKDLDDMIEEGKRLLIQEAEDKLIKISIKNIQTSCETLLTELHNIVEN